MMPYFLAEAEGFEPPVPLGTPVFKTGVIDHSTISPNRVVTDFAVQRYDKKRKLRSETQKIIGSSTVF